MIDIRLPLSPSTNSLYGVNRTGRRYLKPQVKRWRDECGWIVRKERPAKVTGPYAILVEINEGQSGDIDNRLKSVSDFLVWIGLTVDDRFMVDCRAMRVSDVSKGWMRVLVSAFPDPTQIEPLRLQPSVVFTVPSSAAIP